MTQAISHSEAPDSAEANVDALPAPTSAVAVGTERGILMSEAALAHVMALRDKQGSDLCLRVGVRQGGCSGMSYMMDFEQESNIGEHDEVYDYEGFKVVCDR